MTGARLSREERVRIETLWRAGWSFPQIGQALGRHRSTVWRELQRNNSARHGVKNPSRSREGRRDRGRGGLYRWGYQADFAQERSRLRGLRPKAARLGRGQPLREVVLERLRKRWSPEQIAADLRTTYPADPLMRVSHETIYQAIYVQSRGGLRAELKRQVALRSGRTRRRRAAAAGGATRSRRPWTEGLHISTRPAEAADRAVPGHWEGDLVIGARSASAMITLVERSTRYVMLGALPDGRASEAVIDVLSGLAQRLPAHLRRSLAWDCGTEMSSHASFTVATGCPVFFCDPHSPWQRGSNENTNGLLRQYFPKTTADFRAYTQADLDAVAHELNGRPRKTLGWKNPAQALDELLVATAS
jgi:transposase, IS30 family